MITRPPILESPPWTFPIPEVTRLNTGLTVWTYNLPGQFILSCNLVLELPLNAEPEGKEGVATIAVRTLDEGTHAHPGSAFARALEEVGAHFNGLVGLSTTQCLLDLPYDGLDCALALFAEAVTTPAYAPKDVARIQANRLAEIEQQESRGSFLASTALRKSVLASHLRIARPAGGSSDQVSAIHSSDVTGFHSAHYRSDGATLIIAGDLSGIDAIGSAVKAFDGWNPCTPPTPPDPVSPGTPSHHLIHREGAVQADIRLGWYGIDRGDPRWAPLQVGLAIMGGTFNSRLNAVLREERGYTYGVSMSAHPFRSGGTIDVATSTRTSAAPDLIEETLEILMATEPFTQDEVHNAVGYLTLSAPLSLDTADAVASQAATIAAAHLDLDHVTSTLRDLRRVTPESAMEAYRALIDPHRASIIVVGDTEEIPAMDFDFVDSY